MDKLTYAIDYLLRELFSSYYFPTSFLSKQRITEQYILGTCCSVQFYEPHVGAVWFSH